MGSKSRRDPLVVFIHIPKTAGSSVNAALTRHFARGHEHCEHIMSDTARLREVAGRVDWISGHVPLHLMRGRLMQVTDRPLRFFSVLREPLGQVRSHYNWLIEIFKKGRGFYNSHSDAIKMISQQLRASDNSDPEVIIKNLDAYSGLFLNTQAGLLLGKNFNWNSGKVLKHLGKYEFIAAPNHLDDLLTRMCGRPQPALPRHNVARYHFDPDIFATPRLRNFLMRRNFLDQMVFQIARAPLMRAAISSQMRVRPKRAENSAKPKATTESQ